MDYASRVALCYLYFVLCALTVRLNYAVGQRQAQSTQYKALR